MNQLDLFRLRYHISGVRLLLETLKLGLLLRKYDPMQPRVPAGRPKGGRWTDWGRGQRVAGPYNELNRVKCDFQYDRDIFQCSLVAGGTSRYFCEEQARSRQTACMKDLPIPDLIYLLGSAE